MSNTFRAAVLTASDKGAEGRREDKSGELIKAMLIKEGYSVVDYAVLPDDFDTLKNKMLRICENSEADLILTTGGTGFSPRDITPEATLAIADRQAPGIAEAIRANSMKYTSRAMLSRAASVICRGTLIVNLPGSPKAVKESLEFVLPDLLHGLEILTGKAAECARAFNE